MSSSLARSTRKRRTGCLPQGRLTQTANDNSVFLKSVFLLGSIRKRGNFKSVFLKRRTRCLHRFAILRKSTEPPSDSGITSFLESAPFRDIALIEILTAPDDAGSWEINYWGLTCATEQESGEARSRGSLQPPEVTLCTVQYFCRGWGK